MRREILLLFTVGIFLGACMFSPPKGKVFDNSFNVLGTKIQGKYLFRQVVFSKENGRNILPVTVDYPISGTVRVKNSGVAAYMVGVVLINPDNIYYQVKEKVYFRQEEGNPWPRNPLYEEVHKPPKNMTFNNQFFQVPFKKAGHYRFHFILLDDMGHSYYEERVRYCVVE